MATLAELWTLMENPALKEKVAAACVIEAGVIQNELVSVDNHANRVKWAKKVFENPTQAGDDLLKAVISENNDATIANLTNATDAQIKTAVSNAVDIFADGS